MSRPQETSQHDLLPALVEAVKTTRASRKNKKKTRNCVVQKKKYDTAFSLWTLRFYFVYFVQLVFKKL